MDMQRVRSSAIHSVGYDADTQRLRIKFTNSLKSYDYCRVPIHLYQSLMAASSKGDFYKRHIDGRYRCP